MTDHDTQTLAGCSPLLIAAVDKVIAAMAALGFTVTVTDGLRTTEQQAQLYTKGRTAPGPIVTYADGILKRSNHQTGHAVDCAFRIDGVPSWDARLPWKCYGACGEALGLVWGGSWRSLVDFPHLELP